MRINFGEIIEIEDLGKHSALTVIRLGVLLAGTVAATPDPKRKNFYDVEEGSTIFYIYVSPANEKVFLIAAWEKSLAQCNSQVSQPLQQARWQPRLTGSRQPALLCDQMTDCSKWMVP
jgi:hypothetical protein